MLGLLCKTNPGWIEVATLHADEIINDHAHCEKKAAAFAMALIQRYPGHSRLVSDMLEIAKEEIDHFATVHNLILERGSVLHRDRGNAYARKLHDLIRKQDPNRLMDSLIVGALIEARSSLLASEAGHYKSYTDIARVYFPATQVRQRLKEMLEAEAVIVRSLANSPSMHG
jgi:tRNA-(ms[2]io[6]A)-hydroxylase